MGRVSGEGYSKGAGCGGRRLAGEGRNWRLKRLNFNPDDVASRESRVACLVFVLKSVMAFLERDWGRIAALFVPLGAGVGGGGGGLRMFVLRIWLSHNWTTRDTCRAHWERAIARTFSINLQLLGQPSLRSYLPCAPAQTNMQSIPDPARVRARTRQREWERKMETEINPRN